MKDLGRKPPDYEKMYKTPNKNEKQYSKITLPMSIMDGKKIKKGEKLTVCISGEVTAVRSDEYGDDLTLEVKEGEVNEGESKEGDEGTVI